MSWDDWMSIVSIVFSLITVGLCLDTFRILRRTRRIQAETEAIRARRREEWRP